MRAKLKERAVGLVSSEDDFGSIEKKNLEADQAATDLFGASREILALDASTLGDIELATDLKSLFGKIRNRLERHVVPGRTMAWDKGIVLERAMPFVREEDLPGEKLAEEFNKLWPRRPLVEIAAGKKATPGTLQNEFVASEASDLILGLKGWRHALIGHVEKATSVFSAAHSHLDDVSAVADRSESVAQEIVRIERELGIAPLSVDALFSSRLQENRPPSAGHGLRQLSVSATPQRRLPGGGELWASPAEIPSGRSSLATPRSSPPIAGVRRPRGDDDLTPPPARRRRLEHSWSPLGEGRRAGDEALSSPETLASTPPSPESLGRWNPSDQLATPSRRPRLGHIAGSSPSFTIHEDPEDHRGALKSPETPASSPPSVGNARFAAGSGRNPDPMPPLRRGQSRATDTPPIDIHEDRPGDLAGALQPLPTHNRAQQLPDDNKENVEPDRSREDRRRSRDGDFSL